MKYAIKIEIFPTLEQAKILDSQSRICNWLYNHLLEIANNLRKEYKETQSEEYRLWSRDRRRGNRD